jgi:hypothetical protein
MRWLSALIVGFAVVIVQATTWGGDHVRMNVTGSGAELEFDCATGTITETMPETDGAFSLKGTFTPQRGGPSRDDNPRAASATYSGTIERDTMSLHIVLERQNQEAGRYVLTRGHEGILRKCR